MRPTPLLLLSASILIPGGDRAPTAAVEIVFAPEEGTVLRRTHQNEMEASQTGYVVTVDGEEVEGVLEAAEMDASGQERIVVTDEILSVGEGRPLWLRREFEVLSSENTWEFEGEEEPLEESLVCDLEGKTVDILWDEEEEEYRFTVTEDEALAEDMDYRVFLPDGEVTEGESWELGREALLRIIWAGGIMGFYEAQTESAESMIRRQQGEMDAVEAEGEATFEGVREERGVRVAVIAFELEMEQEYEYEPEVVEAEYETMVRVLGSNRTFEGELVWDLEHRHLQGVFIEVEGEIWALDRLTMEAEGREAEVGYKRTMSIESEYTVTVDRR